MTEEITEDELVKWENLAERATPGPWFTGPWHYNYDDEPRSITHTEAKLEYEKEMLHRVASGAVDDDMQVRKITCGSYDEYGCLSNLDDAAFIAEARTALPRLLKAYRELLSDFHSVTKILNASSIPLILAEYDAGTLTWEEAAELIGKPLLKALREKAAKEECP